MQNDLSRIHPMTVSEILGEAWTLYSNNFALFLSIVAVLLVPQAIIDILIPRLAWIVSLFTNAAAISALIFAIAARYMGRPTTIGEAYSSLSVGKVINFVVASFIWIITIWTVFLPVKWAFFQQAVVLEDRSIFDSLSRSWDITKGHWWRVFGIALLVFLIAALAGGLLGAIFRSLSPSVAALIGAVISIVIQPWTTGALTMLYYDILARDHMGAPVMATTAPPPVVPPATQ